jgi:SAM-dependent methyltransferase
MSTPQIYEAVLRAIEPSLRPGAAHLDVGAGRGELIREIARSHQVRSQACDFHDERFAGGVPCAQVNLNRQRLPYEDERFDVVTSSEVVEHLENYRALLRELHRVARAGAVVVVTTPNVLNVASRLRSFLTGFAVLFGPLPVRNDKLYSTGGHITPIPFFYLAHALLDAGFEDVAFAIDKTQRSSAVLACLFWPLIALARLRFMHRERTRYRTLTAQNEALVAQNFSWQLLVGRTIVVSARKPAAAHRVPPGLEAVGSGQQPSSGGIVW